MNRHRAVILSLLVLAALTAACSRKPERVLFGVALTQSNHPAVEMAVREINAGGGVNGVPIELAGLDWKVASTFQPQDILDWADRFAAMPELVAVIGHSDSASTLSAAAVYNRHEIPQIVTIATNPAITNIGDWTYRLCISDLAQGPALAEYAVEEWGKKKIGIFYVNDDYGRGLASIFEKRILELGGAIAFSVMHRNTPAEEDLDLIRSTLGRAKLEGEPDLIALFQRAPAARETMKAIREANLDTDILGGDNLSTLGYSFAPEHNFRVRFSQFFFPDPDSERTASFLEGLQRTTNQRADYGHALAYDAVHLLRDAILAKGFTRAGVKAFLDSLIEHKTRVEGVAGAYVIGPDHDARRAFHIVEIRGGSEVLLKTLRATL